MSAASLDDRFWAKVWSVPGPLSDDCWLWTGASQKGYGQFRVSRNLVVRAHRYAFGTVPDGLDLLHSCDNGCCVRRSHLRPGTDLENARDAIDRGRIRHTAKLTWSQVRQIRASYRSVNGKELAMQYGVSKATIWDIVRGITWRAA